MRLPTDDEQLAVDTIAAAAEAGITVFDTARTYGPEAEPGHNERLLARALRYAKADQSSRIVTKGGMRRAGGRWITDGRAKAIRADCEASLEALDGFGIDLYLVHAPDPGTPWKTSVRALARLVDESLVKRVGVANVNRAQLDEALELAPIAAAQVALSPFDDRALRGGVVERCADQGITLMAHSPLGGPRQSGRLIRQGMAEAALAWLLELSPVVVAIAGARRPETARSAARAATLRLTDRERADLGVARPARAQRRAASGDVVLVMGIPGAGKSRVAEEYVARGYLRLNRDERGGTLRELADELDERLAAGARQIVLDNTYLTRASRSYVIDAGGRHGVRTRCIWLDTPLAQAQVNMVKRLLERVGSLPGPDELKELSRREPSLLAPTSQMRAVRELEPPSLDEGFADIEEIPFVRGPAARGARGGAFVAAAAADHPLDDPAMPHLVFDWRPGGTADALADAVSSIEATVDGPLEAAVCPHPGGPPICWCRPPLPGLVLAFARKHGIDPSRSVLIGASAAHKTLATTLGARYVSVA
jgi:aryl-alcohol dehydrogenase-like predicted oxidoreductase/adenylate kinase family enzyme